MDLARAAKAHVRALQRQQERERGRRVLRADSPGYGSAAESDAEASDGGGRGSRRKRQRTKQDEQVFWKLSFASFLTAAPALNLDCLVIDSCQPSYNW